MHILLEFTSVMMEISVDTTSASSHCPSNVQASFNLASNKVKLSLEHNIDIVPKNIPVIIGGESGFQQWMKHKDVSNCFLIYTT